MFKTVFSEKQYIGLLHPIIGDHYIYNRLPMGTKNSHVASGRFGLSFVQHLLEKWVLFFGISMDNSITLQLSGHPSNHTLVEGRIQIGPDKLPSVLIWLHVDDLMLRTPTKAKLSQALLYVMD